MKIDVPSRGAIAMLLLLLGSANSAKADNAPDIFSAIASGATLTISTGNISPDKSLVFLNGSALTVTSYSAASGVIVATLPALAAGTYRLEIKPSINGNAIASADVTIGAAGLQGPAGPAGATGPQGPAGATGATGAVGATGATGSSGPQGPAGLAGANGAQGPVGPAGANGAIGPAGPAGPQGSVGATGPTGAAGADGAVGPQGPAGPATGPSAVEEFTPTGAVTVITNGNSAGVLPVTLPNPGVYLILARMQVHTNAPGSSSFSFHSQLQSSIQSSNANGAVSDSGLSTVTLLNALPGAGDQGASSIPILATVVATSAGNRFFIQASNVTPSGANAQTGITIDNATIKAIQLGSLQ